jgi:predicted nucleic acid-binding protein
MNRPGVLLDAGPLVALLSKNDASHQRAVTFFSECAPPFRTCEAVLSEACFLMRRVHRHGPAEVLALGARGVYEVALRADTNWPNLEALLKKYADRPGISRGCLPDPLRGDP